MVDSPEQDSLLRVELERLRDEAVRQVERCNRRIRFWVYVDVGLGFPAALLAGVSGAAGLASADARIPAALIALVAAGFSSGAAFLRSDTRRIANKRARQAWAGVEAKARLVLADDLDPEALRQALRALFDSRQAAMSAYEGGLGTDVARQ